MIRILMISSAVVSGLPELVIDVFDLHDKDKSFVFGQITDVELPSTKVKM